MWTSFERACVFVCVLLWGQKSFRHPNIKALFNNKLMSSQSCLFLEFHCSITCVSDCFEKSWGVFPGHESRTHSRHFCNMSKHTVWLEPPPCSYDTYHCIMDLWRKRGKKGKDILDNCIFCLLFSAVICLEQLLNWLTLIEEVGLI